MSIGQIIDLQALADHILEDKLVPLKDALVRLGGVNLYTGYTWIREGKLVTVQINGRYFVRESDLRRILREGM